MVPFDDKSPFVTSGLRLGTPAMTTRGFGTEEFIRVAQLIDRVLRDSENEEVQRAVEQDVNALCEAFPLYDFAVA
jgi:glycine hydroxymethyltransferase